HQNVRYKSFWVDGSAVGLRGLISVGGCRSFSRLSAIYFAKTLGPSSLIVIGYHRQLRPLGCCRFWQLIGVIGVDGDTLVVGFDLIGSQVYRYYESITLRWGILILRNCCLSQLPNCLNSMSSVRLLIHHNRIKDLRCFDEISAGRFPRGKPGAHPPRSF